MHLNTFTRLLSACLLYLFTSLSFAAASNHMLTIDVDKQPIDESTFKQIDLKKTLVQLTSTTTGKAININMENALTHLSRHALGIPVINGLSVHSELALNEHAAHLIADLAKKSILLTSSFTFDKAAHWDIVFKAEAQNPHILSAVYGTTAMKQIEATPNLAEDFVKSGIAFSHIYLPANINEKQAEQFWMSVAKATKQSKTAFGIIELASDNEATIDMNIIVKNAIEASDGYVVWIAGNNETKITPIAANETSLAVWRKSKGLAKAFVYKRDYSPQGLYLALGSNQMALQLIKKLAKRAQEANQYRIELLGDAENNIHTYAVLLDFANTIIANQNVALLPPMSPPVIQSKLNIILQKPNTKTIDKILAHREALKESITTNHYLGIFDFSDHTDKKAYEALAQLMRSTSITNLAYNTSMLSNLQLLLALCKEHQISDIYLGPDASTLYLGNDIKQADSSSTVHTYTPSPQMTMN